MTKTLQTLAAVDRVEKSFVIVMVPAPGSGNNPDKFQEMPIPVKRFKTLPKPGAVIPVDIAAKDVITLNTGSKIFCEVEFSLFGAQNKTITRQYHEPCKLSGLYDNPTDDTAIRMLRSKFWQQCRQEKEKLEEANPDKSVFISKTAWWTDHFTDRQIFSGYVRDLGAIILPGSEQIPGTF